MPVAAVRSKAVEPADDHAPIGRVVLCCPAEAIAVQESWNLNVREGGR